MKGEPKMITGIVVKERPGYVPVLCENTPSTAQLERFCKFTVAQSSAEELTSYKVHVLDDQSIVHSYSLTEYIDEITPKKQDKVPGGRYWEPEDDRTDEELMETIGDTADIPELPFE